MKELKTTIIGIFFIIIGLSIFGVSNYITKDLKLISTASILIFFFVGLGGAFLFGKDRIIENLYNSVIRLIDRIKR